MCYPLDDLRAQRIVDPPTGCQMRTAHHADALDRGVVTHSVNAGPLFGPGVEVEGLIAGAYVKRTWARISFVGKLHGKNVHLGGNRGQGSILDPRAIAAL